MSAADEWHPGSFTKNFSWGPADRGLKELYDIIRIGFNNTPEDVPRSLFRDRIAATGRPDYIPLNFFLYNKIKHGMDFVTVDELVFQAINFRHSANFDKLALFAFNLSLVGRWKKSADYQARPALWATYYVCDRLASQLDWQAQNVNADDIEDFVTGDARYKGKTTRKLATNLAYLYKQGRLADYRTKKAERWWLGALFLTLDRASEEIIAQGRMPQEERYEEYAIRYGFHLLSGPRSVERDLAAVHFIKLYSACGGKSRLSEEATRERQKILLPQVQHFANNPEPVGVFHPSNPRARGAIPRACAMLAQYLAGFEWIDIDELDDFDVEIYVRNRTREALDGLRAKGVTPTMSVEELLQMTRDG
jgi:hypothetical protein